jgi:hypothetical protein
MKVKFNKRGVLVVKGQTQQEAKALRSWCKNNQRQGIANVDDLNAVNAYNWGNIIFDFRVKQKLNYQVIPEATPQAPPQLFNNIASAALSLLRAIDARQNNDLEWFPRELKCEHDKLEYVIKDAKKKLGIVD